MEIEVLLDAGAKMPAKAHKSDAGFDLFSKYDCAVYPHDHTVIDTGAHVIIPDGYCGLLVSKSGLNCNYNLNSTGLIDAGYTGSIQVNLQNHSSDYYYVKAGDKVSQLIILPVPDVELVETDHAPDTDRGDAGFGSTGK